jgi:hypothetical protein
VRVILHIGPHKTGTTAIQSFMHLNAPQLARMGVAYPEWAPGERNHHGFVHGLRTAGMFDATVSRIREMLEAAASSGCGRFVLSSEMFVEHEVPIWALDEVFAGHEVSVLAYIRRPDDLLASAYAQLVSDGASRRSAPVDADPPPYDASYSTVFPKWMQHFPPGRMVIAPFDPGQWAGGSLFLDFAGMIGVAATAGLVLEDPRMDWNRRLPAVLVEVVRQSNAVLSLAPDAHDRWVHRLKAMAGGWPGIFPGGSGSLPPPLARRCFESLGEHLDSYRPHFRAGFDESFLRCAPTG